METLKKNAANLLKVKTIVTMVVIGVFAALALRGDISSDNVMIIVTAVTSFYFGTQHEKKEDVSYAEATPSADVIVDGFGK